MLAYEAPTQSAFRCRRTFYATIKDVTETIGEWFARIQDNINGCDFGELTDVMFIDKFISGLDDDLVSKFTETSTLTAEQSLLIALSNNFYIHSSTIDIKVEPLPNLTDFLSLDHLKSEGVNIN